MIVSLTNSYSKALVSSKLVLAATKLLFERAHFAHAHGDRPLPAWSHSFLIQHYAIEMHPNA